MDMDPASSSQAASLPREDPAPDPELIRRIIGGERALFAILMRRYNQRLFRAVRAIVGTDHEAEDVVQQTYVTAFHKLEQFRGEAQFSTWLTRIAINEALQRARKSARRHVYAVVSEAEGMIDDTPTPEDQMYRREIGRLLEKQIDGLPDSLRIVFVMRDVQELSTAETAACLELSDEAVRVRLFRARRLLQERLSELIDASSEAFRFDGARCDRIVLAVAKSIGL